MFADFRQFHNVSSFFSMQEALSRVTDEFVEAGTNLAMEQLP